MRVYNFSAGPAVLPEEVLTEAAAVRDVSGEAGEGAAMELLKSLRAVSEK